VSDARETAAAALASARFPAISAGKGHYESFYLKAAHPADPLAVWIRYTVHKRPGGAPTGSLWFTLFDGAAHGPLASKVTLGADRLGVGGGDYIRIGDSRLSPQRASGRARSELLDTSWSLAIDAQEAPFRHLPREWMYRAPIPRTKLESPQPAARFTGRVTAGGRTIEVAGWPGMVGHNWGAEHAERWIWLQGAAFAGHGADTWLDAAVGRVKLGPLLTPWIANAQLALDGVHHRLGGPERVRATHVEESPQGCEFVLPGRRATVRGTVTADPKDAVGWVYADPAGPEHHAVNCSIASMRLEVRRPGAPAVELEAASGATYELGMRERDHGVPIQPFPDG
jgi:hypothetical protein